MAIRQLSLTDFRNLRSTTLDLHPQLNLVVGENGSGKTSLLEAIHVLCQAQSFRTHQLNQCIQNCKDSFLLFGRFDNFKAGLSRSTGKLNIHVNGEAVQRRSDLVRRVPIQIVNAETFALIEGAPTKRRAFVDWCLFHVEPTYADAWLRFRHAIKQRNQLLRSKRDIKLVDYWDEHIIEPSLKIHEMRQTLCRTISAIIDEDLSDLLQGIDVELKFQAGWDPCKTLVEAMAQNRDTDIRRGFTGSGIHRDDLLLRSAGRDAKTVLSRGECKRVCLTLLLAALKHVARISGKRIILLIDDLGSELDLRSQASVYGELDKLDLQLVISNIDTDVPEPLKSKEFKWFHVEHGTIKPRIFS